MEWKEGIYSVMMGNDYVRKGTEEILTWDELESEIFLPGEIGRSRARVKIVLVIIDTITRLFSCERRMRHGGIA